MNEAKRRELDAPLCSAFVEIVGFNASENTVTIRIEDPIINRGFRIGQQGKLSWIDPLPNDYG